MFGMDLLYWHSVQVCLSLFCANSMQHCNTYGVTHVRPTLFVIVNIVIRISALCTASRTGYLDDLCLVQLLRGICLRDQVKFSDAEECLLDVIKRSAP